MMELQPRKYPVSSRHPLYTCWYNMRNRCMRPEIHNAKSYTEKGIDYCIEWDEFTNFYNDMAPTWKPGLTLDRKDNSRGYCKDNCRWVTNRDNARNRDTTKLTQEKADEIRRLYVSGFYTQTQLANKYGVRQGHISDVVLGKVWGS